MRQLLPIAEQYQLPIVEDAVNRSWVQLKEKCRYLGKHRGISLHPLKNLNVWSDGRVIVTDDPELAKKLQLLRNHGLVDRDTVGLMGYNSRLDTIQAIVGNFLLQTGEIARKRIENAAYYDKQLGKISGIQIPPRPQGFRIVYHLYIVFAEQREALLKHCLDQGIEAKVHYQLRFINNRV